MSTLTMIRHAQASFMKANYDQLSPLGETQSRVLGTYLADKGMSFDKIYIGPLKRHWQTAEGVKEIFLERSIPWPEPIMLETLDEHKGMEVMASLLPVLVDRFEVLQEWRRKAEEQPEKARKYQLLIFNHVMALWAKGELDVREHGLAPWAEFRAQVNAAMQQIVSENGKGVKVAAFTSGGTMSAAVGYALKLEADEKIMDLNGIVQNTAMSTFLFSEDRLTLKSFNELPHLAGEMITFV
ncbi:MAG: histidine phosphatase family protein [Saprospiraceae bacterium]|nr:histidine phosphatase family protein [Saprospiraceae bacterium]